MENKIIFLIGASGSGKSTVESKFLEEDADKYGGFSHIVSHATRKIRNGEVDGVDYYFINDTEFDELLNSNKFIQTISHAGARKGSSMDEWIDKLNKGNIIMPVLLDSTLELMRNLTVIDPDINDNIYIIYFDISEEEALNRMVHRYSAETNFSTSDLHIMYKNYMYGIEFPENIENIFNEINNRLHDIKMLYPTRNYTKNIIHVNEGDSKEYIYKQFMKIINKIYKK